MLSKRYTMNSYTIAATLVAAAFLIAGTVTMTTNIAHASHGTVAQNAQNTLNTNQKGLVNANVQANIQANCAVNVLGTQC